MFFIIVFTKTDSTALLPSKILSFLSNLISKIITIHSIGIVFPNLVIPFRNISKKSHLNENIKLYIVSSKY